MATFRELQDRSLDGSVRSGLTDLTEVKSLINQVYLEMSALVRPTVIDSTQTLTVDVADYSLASDFLLTDVQALRHLRIRDAVTAQNYLLERVQPDYILMLRQTLTTAGGWMRNYAQDGLDTLRFFPAPSSTTINLTITYVARPLLLVLDTDVPVGVPVEFHDVIVLGTLARSLRIWKPEYARAYRADYVDGLKNYRKWLNQRGGAFAPKAVVKGSRAPRGFHDNSVDYSGMR